LGGWPSKKNVAQRRRPLYRLATIKGRRVFRLKIVGIYQSGIAEIDEYSSYCQSKGTCNAYWRAQELPNGYSMKIKQYGAAHKPMAKGSGKTSSNKRQLGIKRGKRPKLETGSNIPLNLITYAVSITLLIVGGLMEYITFSICLYTRK